jgi:membrane peptidoglycan carboxypeptidase
VMKATAQSVNGAFASMALKLDQCKTKQIAESLGIHTAIRTDNPKTKVLDNEIQTNPAAILGTNDIAPLTIAAAYAGIANNGIFCKPRAVDSIVDRDGNTKAGQAEECSPSLISADVAATAMYALQGAMNGYPGNPRDGIPHFGKTGTTNSSKQTWLVNSSSAVTSVTWVGNIKGDYPIRTWPGGNARHNISKAIMRSLDGKYGGHAFPKPPGRLLTGTGVTVDEIVGLEPEVAKSMIEARGLVYADGGEIDSDLPAGQIAKSDPPAGTILASGMTVTAYTSNGSMTAVPDVVSSHPDAVDARTTLHDAGFDNVTEYCVVLPPGDPNTNKVVESNPAPGAIYKRTNEVRLGVGGPVCP